MSISQEFQYLEMLEVSYKIHYGEKTIIPKADCISFAQTGTPLMCIFLKVGEQISHKTWTETSVPDITGQL